MVMALWDQKNDWLRHGDIIRRLKDVKPRTIERVLARLEKRGVLERRRDRSASYYRKLEAPKEFIAVSYLAELDARLTPGMAYEFEVGGMFSEIGFGRIVGFPAYRDEELRPDEKELIRLLTARLGFIFHALSLIRNATVMRRMGIEVGINEMALLTSIAEGVAQNVSRASKDDPEALLKALGPNMLPPTTAAFVRDNLALRRKMADVELTSDFFLSEGTIDDYIQKTADSTSRYLEMSVSQLLGELEASRRRETEYVTMRRATRKKPAGFKDLFFRIPPEISGPQHEIQRALAYKVGEAFKSKGLKEINELGLVMSAHPWTSSQFADVERLVHWAVESAARYKEKGVEIATPKFARDAGDSVAQLHGFDLDGLRPLRRKPWFVKYVGANWAEFTKGFVAGRERVREESRKFMDGFLGNLDSLEEDLGKSGPSA